MRHVSLFVVLFVFWLALSGHYTLFLVTMGMLISAGCVLVAMRMGTVDGEGHPIDMLPATLTYYPWLAWEICKSGWSVTKIVLDPALPISPTMTRVVASQQTTAGMATYANSITLTPGTITTAANGNVLTVHALVADGATDVEGGGMDERVTRFERGL
jgi:multicomponent Na+:H+ antiporter subunit E